MMPDSAAFNRIHRALERAEGQSPHSNIDWEQQEPNYPQKPLKNKG